MAKKHHLIPLPWLLFPGAFLVIGLFTLLFGNKDVAYFFVGVAIVCAILIHRENEEN